MMTTSSNVNFVVKTTKLISSYSVKECNLIVTLNTETSCNFKVLSSIAYYKIVYIEPLAIIF